MSVPSFLYSGVDSNIKQLNDELESLGGGNARVANLELNCIIEDRIDAKEGQVLWPLGKSVGLRDPRVPKNHPVQEGMKYIPVSSATRVSMLSRKASPWVDKSSEISKWLFDGFNATVISHGERMSDKTRDIFGTADNNHWGFVPETLHNIYQKVESSSHVVTVALSVWALHKHDIIDLCAPPSPISERQQKQDEESGRKNWLNFVCIECPTLDVALQVLNVAFSRCPENRGKPHSQFMQDSRESHLFLRVLLHQASRVNDPNLRGSISHLHVVELIGSTSTDSPEYRRLPEETRIFRREVALQFASLSKVLGEIRDISRAASGPDKRGSPRPKITSARDSKLTVILAPLIQGNTKTWVFLHLMDGESHYAACAHALMSFEGVTDITSACHRVQDLNLRSLEIRHYDTVLPPRFDERPQRTSRDVSGDAALREECTHSLPTVSFLPSPKRNAELASSPERKETGRDRDKFSGQRTTNEPQSSKERHPDSKKQEDNQERRSLTSEGFDHLMQEFNALMSQVNGPEKVPADTGLDRSTLHVRDWEPGRWHDDHPPARDTRPKNHSAHDRIERRSSEGLDIPHQPDMQRDSHFLSDSEIRDTARNSRYCGRVAEDRGSDADIRSAEADDDDDNYRHGCDETGRYAATQSDGDIDSDGDVEIELPRDHRSADVDSTGEQGFELIWARQSNYDWGQEGEEATYEEDEATTDSIDLVRGEAVRRVVERRSSEKEASKVLRDGRFDENYLNTFAREAYRDGYYGTTGPLGQSSDSDGEQEERADDDEGSLDRLKHINESLLLSLQSESEVRVKLEDKLKRLEEELMEAKTVAEIESEGHKVEVLRLKSQMRKLANEHTSTEVLDSLEEDLSRVLKENESLKKTNAALEIALAGEGSAGVLVGEDPGLVWTASGMQSASGEPTISTAEHRVLRAKLKRAEKSVAEMSSKYEELRRKERIYLLAGKQSGDLSRRLKGLHADNEELRSALTLEHGQKEAALKNVSLLKNETVALQLSERSVREERSRALTELSICRQRMREMDMERKAHYAINRFVSKHSSGDRPEPAQRQVRDNRKGSLSDTQATGGYTNRYLEGAASEPQSLLETPFRWRDSDSMPGYSGGRSVRRGGVGRVKPSAVDDTFSAEAISGVAGLSDALYVREEEMQPLSWTLEKSLVDLHNTIALTAPSVLPLVNQLGEEVRRERSASHKQRMEWLMQHSNEPRGGHISRSGARRRRGSPTRSEGGDGDSSHQSIVRCDWGGFGEEGSVASIGRGRRRSASAARNSYDGNSVDGGSVTGSGQKMAFFRRVEDKRNL